MADVRSMLDQGATIGEISAHLDALAPEERWRQMKVLGRRYQAKLYDIAVDAPPFQLDHYVPDGLGDLVSVEHKGRNSLPIPGFRTFAKVFARQPGGGTVGYNEGISRYLFGPGYFTVVDTPDHWADRGPLVVDYYQVPKGKVPRRWPWLRPNWLGLQVFVYFQMRDFMRKVSEHVSIGAAYKGDNMKMGQYFVLVRQDR